MIGALRHRLIIQSANAAEDAYGGQSDPWATPSVVATVWGSIEPLKGSERLRAMQLEDRVSHRITIRHRSGVTAGHRVVTGTRTFNIRAVINVGERDRFLELLCDEGVAT